MKEKLFYAVMYTDHSQFLGTGAPYLSSQLLLKGLTNPEIALFTGTTNRIDAGGFNPTNDPEQTGLSTTQLATVIDDCLAGGVSATLGIISLEQGQWLYSNHPAFMPTENTEV